MTVIDGTGGAPRAGMDVLIADGRFAAIRPTCTDNSPASAGEPVLDGRGGYLLPGLWEGHTHLRDYGASLPEPERLAHLRNVLAGYLGEGITSVCDLGGMPELSPDLRDASKEDTALASLFATEVVFTGIDGWPVTGSTGDRSGVMEVGSVDDARRYLQELALGEVDYVKCMLDGKPGGGRRLPPAALEVIIAAAHEAGKKALVHIATGTDLRDAVLAGADCIEHSPIPRDPRDPSEAEQLAGAMAEAGTLYCPTIATWEQLAYGARPDYLDRLITDGILTPDGAQEIMARPGYGRPFPKHPADECQVRFEYAMRTLPLFHEANVKLVAGSDIARVMPTPARALLRELQLFARAGVPNSAIIAAATSLAAEKVGKQATMGTVTVGSVADAVLLDADPVTDISHLVHQRHLRAVISSGHIFHIGSGSGETGPGPEADGAIRPTAPVSCSLN
ncbi:amidohydrolase family protein [Streptomyces qinzhouensis]|uniref:amidohydrolase family protein n=1 Tax=Streptomyces qinzhouensis TaxID=2599401 RepID=UPI001C96BD84|nr:amidohydrolase family protein [Streptomyces qinzhouensis]